jgi:hypothetical protein
VPRAGLPGFQGRCDPGPTPSVGSAPALLSYYGYLAEGELVDGDDLAELRAEILELKPSLLEKAERYAEVRHDPSVPEVEKDRIREELFEGDHFWPLL